MTPEHKAEPKSVEKFIEQLRDLVKVQCTDGNWNHDEYMRGMANGLICALSVLTGEEPKYKEALRQRSPKLPSREELRIKSLNDSFKRYGEHGTFEETEYVLGWEHCYDWLKERIK